MIDHGDVENVTLPYNWEVNREVGIGGCGEPVCRIEIKAIFLYARVAAFAENEPLLNHIQDDPLEFIQTVRSNRNSHPGK